LIDKFAKANFDSNKVFPRCEILRISDSWTCIEI